MSLSNICIIKDVEAFWGTLVIFRNKINETSVCA